MKKSQETELLKKFYTGETSDEEEIILKNEMPLSVENTPEKDYFEFIRTQGSVPGNLEKDLWLHVENRLKKKKTTLRRIYSAVSIAASLIIIFSIYYDIRETKKQKLEDSFFLMEQALYHVSETMKPEKQEDMVVLWVDNNVEIIIN